MTTEQAKARQDKSDRKFQIGLGMIIVGGILVLVPALMLSMDILDRQHPAFLAIILEAVGLVLLMWGAILGTSDA